MPSNFLFMNNNFVESVDGLSQKFIDGKDPQSAMEVRHMVWGVLENLLSVKEQKDFLMFLKSAKGGDAQALRHEIEHYFRK